MLVILPADRVAARIARLVWLFAQATLIARATASRARFRSSSARSFLYRELRSNKGREPFMRRPIGRKIAAWRGNRSCSEKFTHST